MEGRGEEVEGRGLEVEGGGGGREEGAGCRVEGRMGCSTGRRDVDACRVRRGVRGVRSHVADDGHYRVRQ